MDIKIGKRASKQVGKKKGGVKMYEVQTKFIYGWENVWMDEDKPIVFKTKKEAQAELKDNVESWSYESLNEVNRIAPLIKSKMKSNGII